uniref:C-type lectin domain-containing protein n=1 Tax=Acrobeloides nanus TaxID=290746 RepID=A0A914E4S2_9BILA
MNHFFLLFILPVALSYCPNGAQPGPNNLCYQVFSTPTLCYANWAPGQPVNAIGNCLVQGFVDLRWSSVLCAQKKPFVCQSSQQ